MTIQYTLNEVIDSIKKINPVKVDVNLHMHFDKDENYNYTGEHGVSVEVYESPRISKSHTDVHKDIYHCSTEECRVVHNEVFKVLRDEFPSIEINRNEYTHR